MRFDHQFLSSEQKRGHYELSLSSDPINIESVSVSDSNGDEIQELLESVDISYLQALCQQCRLDEDGTKEELLIRLRAYADDTASHESKLRRNRIRRVERGVEDNGKTKHRIVAGDDKKGNKMEEEEEERMLNEGIFYYAAPSTTTNNNKTTTSTKLSKKSPEEDDDEEDDGPTVGGGGGSYTNPITAPPPPPEGASINDKGERVVTVYSSADNNDLTGVGETASSLLGMNSDVATQGSAKSSSSSSSYPVGSFGAEITASQTDANFAPSRQRKQPNQNDLVPNQAFEHAREKIDDLLSGLLASTGAPAFLHHIQTQAGDDDDHDQMPLPFQQQQQHQLSNIPFVGFDPSSISSQTLSDVSSVLRSNKGQILRDVLDTYEMNAIGYDGMAGDDIQKGGGHYKEVRKIGAFLEGYRKAEVRRIARGTVTMILGRLMEDGVKSMDEMLSTMMRGGDDSTDIGELNDSLLEYLDEAIEQQERKLDGLSPEPSSSSSALPSSSSSLSPQKNDDNDLENTVDNDFNALWDVTRDDNGQIIEETLDMTKPSVQKQLQHTLDKNQQYLAESSSLSQPPSPQRRPEQTILILLRLLRNRIKAEAAVASDQAGINLRILTYLLHTPNEKQREIIVTKQLGTSLTRLDSFLELIQNAIVYYADKEDELNPDNNDNEESTTNKKMPLNVKTLQNLHDLVQNVKKQQTWKASSGFPSPSEETTMDWTNLTP